MPPDFSIENKIKFSLGRQNENRRRAVDKEGIQKVEYFLYDFDFAHRKPDPIFSAWPRNWPVKEKEKTFISPRKIAILSFPYPDRMRILLLSHTRFQESLCSP